ncbi:MAG: protein kinase [Gemmatimonadaceae bacterium]
MTRPDDAADAARESPAERWARVRPIVEALLAVPTCDRDPLLDRECGVDTRLRHDVERMVLAYESAAKSKNFLAEPAAVAAAMLDDLRAGLTTGGTLAAIGGTQGAAGPTVPTAFIGNGRFALRRELGAGGMGVVFEALDQESGTHVALKVLPLVDPHALFRFKREFRSLAALVHPNLVSLYELIAQDDRWFFTMELIEGDDLLGWVRGGRRGTRAAAGALASLDEVIDEQRLRVAMAQLAIGVGALHANGILHCDLKPPNVLVRRDGTVAILDFGIVLGLSDAAPSGQQLGTLPYMSPEQLSGDPLTTASDWYTVGIILYEALTGRTPFAGAHASMFFAKARGVIIAPSTLVRGVPHDLEALCLELLSAEASRRPSGQEVIARLTSSTTVSTGRAEPSGLRHRLFVGRETQLSALTSALDSAVRGVGSTIYVHGSSGAGKSALIERFLIDVRRDDRVVVLSGRCDEQESVPFKAVDTIVDALTTWLRKRSPPELARLLPADVGLLGRLFRVLERVPAIADAARDNLAVRDPRELRRRAFDALRDVLVRIGDAAPLVVVIDDLQWGDADGGELLAHVLGGPKPPRMLFVAAYRSEYEATSRCLQVLAAAQVNRRGGADPVYLALPALDPSEARTLARVLLDAGDDESAIVRVVEESRGNPFFIHELARYVRTHPRWADQSLTGEFDLDRVLWSRIQQLPAHARELLEIIATAGKPVRNVHWRSASNEATHDPRAMALLRYEHLLRSTGSSADDEVETYHDRIRETVVARLKPMARQGHHRRLAVALAADIDADEETVAVHFAEGGDDERAGVHYANAAAGAERALAFDRAATLYERALELRPGDAAEHRQLLSSLARALANAGRGQRAGMAFERAASLADADERLDLQRQAATQYAISGHIDEGRALFTRVLRGVGLGFPQSSGALMVQLLGRRARLRLRGLRFTQRAEGDIEPTLLRRLDALWAVSTALGTVDVVRVAALQSQALLLALDAGEPRRLSLALAWEAVLTATGGSRTAQRTCDLLRLARRLAQRAESPHASGMMDFAEGWVSFLHGRFPDALTACARAEPVFRDQCIGAWWELSTTRTMMAWTMSHRGDNNQLSAQLRVWEPEARARGDHFMVTNLLAFPVPYERLVADDAAGAARALDEALALWPYEGFHIQHVSVLFSRALMLLYRGDGARACDEVTRKWPAMIRSLQTQNQVTRVMLRDVRARARWLRRLPASIGRDTSRARIATRARWRARGVRGRRDTSLGYRPVWRSCEATSRGRSVRCARPTLPSTQLDSFCPPLSHADNSAH